MPEQKFQQRRLTLRLQSRRGRQRSRQRRASVCQMLPIALASAEVEEHVSSNHRAVMIAAAANLLLAGTSHGVTSGRKWRTPKQETIAFGHPTDRPI